MIDLDDKQLETAIEAAATFLAEALEGAYKNQDCEHLQSDLDYGCSVYYQVGETIRARVAALQNIGDASGALLAGAANDPDYQEGKS